MYCPKCGYQLNDDVAFCGKCGADLRGYKKLAPSVTNTQSQMASEGVTAQGADTVATRGDFGKARSSASGSLLSSISQGGHHNLPRIVIVLCVIIAVAVFGLSHCSADPHASAESLADALEGPMERVFSSEGGEDVGEELGASIIDLMPNQVMGAFEEHGTSREDLAEEFGDALGSFGSLASVLDSFDVGIDFREGYSLNDDYLDNVNEKLQDDMGLDLEVQDACVLALSVTVTAREDTDVLKRGESQTQAADASGLIAIQIDGKWYLWTSELNW